MFTYYIQLNTAAEEKMFKRIFKINIFIEFWAKFVNFWRFWLPRRRVLGKFDLKFVLLRFNKSKNILNNKKVEAVISWKWYFPMFDFMVIISIHPTMKCYRRPTLWSLAIHHGFNETPIAKLHFGTKENFPSSRCSWGPTIRICYRKSVSFICEPAWRWRLSVTTKRLIMYLKQVCRWIASNV